MNNLIYKETLSESGMWSKVVGRGKVLKLTDVEGGANVGMMLYNANERTERYNMPDTLKGQQVFYLRQDLCLHSDMGRLLASIVVSSVGWHDTVCGASNSDDVRRKFGGLSYQDGRNSFHRSGTECFLIELAKWGLCEKDLMPNVNWFSKVTSNSDGELSYHPHHSVAGSTVSLRFEMDTLVVLNCCRHPLDSEEKYSTRRVLLEIFEGEAVAVDDPCYTSHPENERARLNTLNYLKIGGLF